MKIVLKIFVSSAVVLTALVFVMFSAASVSAAQNPNFPSPTRCAGADWNLGSPDNAPACTGSITVSGGGGIGMEQNATATSIFGSPSRLKPDVASLNQFCKQYTGDSASFATYGRMHNYCTACDQQLSYWTGTSWITNTACAGTLNVQEVKCATQCTPVNITCSLNSQCGTNGLVGDSFCKADGSVYKKFKTYTCSNPGTASSTCSSSTADQLITTCTANQTCSGGSCVDQHIACSSNSQCGTDGPVSGLFCKSDGNVYQTNRTFVCNNAGSANSSCSHSDADQKQITCSANQTCSNGACVNQNIRCSANADCGTNTISGSPFCTGNSVYQNYITPTCLNAGTILSLCANPVVPQLVNNCAANQTCSGGTCVTNQTGINISCYASPNPVNVNQQASFICNVSGGNGSYSYIWSGACAGSSAVCTTSFSTPGTQTAVATVTSGNQTNSSSASVTVNQNNNCGYHSYEQCSGNNLYWYNSCGIQQDLIQYCPNGCSGSSCINNNNYVTVQTNPATGIYNNQVTLNGYLYNSNNNSTCSNYVWFQYGPTISYGSETIHQSQNYSGAFSQLISNLYSGNIYHFRAAAQSCLGNVVYGSDMITSGNNNGNNLTVNKTAKNLSNGSGFASSVYANPSDVLLFMITLQATGNQDVQNVFVRDSFPSNLIYKNQLVVASLSNSNYNYSGDIISGINLGTIYAGQTVTITYQAQVASAQNFSYGTTTLNNGVSVTSSGAGYNPTSNASIIVTRSAVYGASTISTGLTNNFWVDSFFLPLLITVILLWMWKSGMFIGIEKWLNSKKKSKQNYSSAKELATRIATIQRAEKV